MAMRVLGILRNRVSRCPPLTADVEPGKATGSFMQSNLVEFLAYYEAVHNNAANRYVHHVAHSVATGGVLFLRRPLLGLALIAMGFVLSWAGHCLFEKNAPAYFDAPGQAGSGAAFTKIQVALGGNVWSGTCFLHLLNRGPLARGLAQPTVQVDGPASGRPGA